MANSCKGAKVSDPMPISVPWLHQIRTRQLGDSTAVPALHGMTAARHQGGDILCAMGPVTHDALVANLLNEAGSRLIAHMTTLLMGFPPQKEETQILGASRRGGLGWG